MENNEDLARSVPWVRPGKPDSRAPEAAIRDVEPGGENVIEMPVHDLGIEMVPKHKRGQAVGIKAQRFVDLLADGQTPGDAARAIGTTVRALNTSEDMSRAIKQLMDVGNVSAAIKREAIRAGLFMRFVRGIESADPIEAKLALEASKQMASDPTIGLGTGEGGVTVNLGDLGGILQRAELPGIERPPLSQELDGTNLGSDPGASDPGSD